MLKSFTYQCQEVVDPRDSDSLRRLEVTLEVTVDRREWDWEVFSIYCLSTMQEVKFDDLPEDEQLHFTKRCNEVAERAAGSDADEPEWEAEDATEFWDA